jgi:catechol 2,3-dioxygenase-like lactoylglutathione lyase family enzyme
MHDPLHDAMFTGAATVFTVADMDASLACYRDAFGFEVGFLWEKPPTYACLRRDDVDLHLVSAAVANRPPGTGAICIFVRDVDALHAEFVREGAPVSGPPATYPYGMREFSAADPDGNRLVFGMAVKG